MRVYRATVHLLLPGDLESHAEACDAVSAALSENLKMSGAILDWQYASRRGRNILGPELVAFDGEEWEADGDIEELMVVEPEPHCERCGTETTWNHYEDNNGLCPNCVDEDKSEAGFREDPRFAFEKWRRAVAGGQTVLGYAEWLASRQGAGG